jgi:hypothetical protein
VDSDPRMLGTALHARAQIRALTWIRRCRAPAPLCRRLLSSVRLSNGTLMCGYFCHSFATPLLFCRASCRRSMPMLRAPSGVRRPCVYRAHAACFLAPVPSTVSCSVVVVLSSPVLFPMCVGCCSWQVSMARATFSDVSGKKHKGRRGWIEQTGRGARTHCTLARKGNGGS